MRSSPDASEIFWSVIGKSGSKISRQAIGVLLIVVGQGVAMQTHNQISATTMQALDIITSISARPAC